MQLFILKTDIATHSMVRAVKSLFTFYPSITDWSVDMEDIDKVLRIEAQDDTSQKEVIKLVQTCGIHCEELTD